MNTEEIIENYSNAEGNLQDYLMSLSNEDLIKLMNKEIYVEKKMHLFPCIKDEVFTRWLGEKENISISIQKRENLLDKFLEIYREGVVFGFNSCQEDPPEDLDGKIWLKRNEFYRQHVLKHEVELT